MFGAGLNAARNTGGSIGVSLVSNVLAHREQFHQSRLAEHAMASSVQYPDTLQQVTRPLRPILNNSRIVRGPEDHDRPRRLVP
jgi:hypothetical protein